MELISINENSISVRDGLSRFTENFVSTQKSMRRNEIKESFPDFPWKDEVEKFYTAEEMYPGRGAEVEKERRRVPVKDIDSIRRISPV